MYPQANLIKFAHIVNAHRIALPECVDDNQKEDQREVVTQSEGGIEQIHSSTRAYHGIKLRQTTFLCLPKRPNFCGFSTEAYWKTRDR